LPQVLFYTMLYFIHTSFLGLTLETGLLSVVDFLSVDFFKKLLLLEAVRKNDSSLKNIHHFNYIFMQHINKQKCYQNYCF